MRALSGTPKGRYASVSIEHQNSPLLHLILRCVYDLSLQLQRVEFVAHSAIDVRWSYNSIAEEFLGVDIPGADRCEPPLPPKPIGDAAGSASSAATSMPGISAAEARPMLGIDENGRRGEKNKRDDDGARASSVPARGNELDGAERQSRARCMTRTATTTVTGTEADAGLFKCTNPQCVMAGMPQRFEACQACHGYLRATPHVVPLPASSESLGEAPGMSSPSQPTAAVQAGTGWCASGPQVPRIGESPIFMPTPNGTPLTHVPAPVVEGGDPVHQRSR